MPRRPRAASGGMAFHVLNRAIRRMTLFETDADYLAFETTLMQAVRRQPGIRLLSYTIMPNHWHLVVWPTDDHDLSEFMRWLTVTHAVRWHRARQTLGTGPVYQGRFKSFPIQTDSHLLTVLRYCERNPLRARLVRSVEQWRWSSLWQRSHPPPPTDHFMTPWPVGCPSDWTAMLNRPQSQAELDVVRHSIKRGSPLGTLAWRSRAAQRLGIELDPPLRGRPRAKK